MRWPSRIAPGTFLRGAIECTTAGNAGHRGCVRPVKDLAPLKKPWPCSRIIQSGAKHLLAQPLEPGRQHLGGWLYSKSAMVAVVLGGFDPRTFAAERRQFLFWSARGNGAANERMIQRQNLIDHHRKSIRVGQSRESASSSHQLGCAISRGKVRRAAGG